MYHALLPKQNYRDEGRGHDCCKLGKTMCNPSIIVCPCRLACHLLQPCPITFWHLLWCYEVPCLDMGGYQVETPHIGRYREYLLPPSLFKGALPKIIIIYLHQRTYGRGHREYKLTFRGIILILCYQVVTSSESW